MIQGLGDQPTAIYGIQAITRISGLPSDQYLIKIESSENKQHPWSNKEKLEAENIFSECYPAIHDHFEKYRQELIDRYDQGHYFWELRSCAYWQEFEKPKIVVPAIAERPSFAPDFLGHFSNNKSTIFIPPSVNFSLGVLNSTVNSWFSTQVCSTKQGGFFDFEPRYSGQLIIPATNIQQQVIIEASVASLLATPTTLTPNPSPACGRGEWERLINGLVYELFFPQDLHPASIYLFDAVAKAGIDRLADLDGTALVDAAREFADTIFAPIHPIQGMLADLQKLEVVRIIEGRD